MAQCGQLLGRWSGAIIELLPWVARLELLGHEPPGEGEALVGRFLRALCESRQLRRRRGGGCGGGWSHTLLGRNIHTLSDSFIHILTVMHT